MEIIGWVGSFLFAICGAPLAYSAWKNKKSDVDINFLTLWFFGEVLTLVYVLYTEPLLPLIANYVFNILCILIVYWYKLGGNK